MKKSITIIKDISTLPIINGSVDNINVGDVLHYKETFPFIPVRVNNVNIAGDVFVAIRTLIDSGYAIIGDTIKISTKGKFIVFESVDDNIVSEQLQILKNYLVTNNIKYVIYEKIFDNIDTISNNYIAESIVKLQDLNDTIIDNINNGYIVICDSWLYTLLSKVDENRDLFNSILCLTSNLILPNNIIYLDIERPNIYTSSRYLNYQYILEEDSVSYDIIKIVKVYDNSVILFDNIKSLIDI